MVIIVIDNLMWWENKFCTFHLQIVMDMAHEKSIDPPHGSKFHAHKTNRRKKEEEKKNGKFKSSRDLNLVHEFLISTIKFLGLK